MKHPFELELGDLEAIDLEFEESLTLEETTQFGGLTLTTLALGEEGGTRDYDPHSRPRLPKLPSKFPLDREPPIYTTMALGEEGGGYYLDA